MQELEVQEGSIDQRALASGRGRQCVASLRVVRIKNERLRCAMPLEHPLHARRKQRTCLYLGVNERSQRHAVRNERITR